MEHTSTPKPRCSRKDDESLHLSYELPHRVHIAKAYPVRAPNGSTIIVYGHEKGLTFLWKGGKPFRQTQKDANNSSRPRDDGAAEAIDDDMIMIDDDGDEQARTNRSTTLEDFEAGEKSADPSFPYPPIIDTFDIPLDTSVLCLAFAPLTSQVRAQTALHESLDPNLPQIFAQDIVLTATCADSSVHLVTVPLMPSQSRPKSSKWRSKTAHEYQDLVVSVPQVRSSLKKVSTAVTMTWTADLSGSASTSPDSTNQDHLDPRARGLPRSRSSSSSEVAERIWTLLLGTTTSEASGLLRIYAVAALCKRARSSILTESLHLLREEHLPALARTISFKPTTYPSRSHTQLLVADAKGVVRLYDPFQSNGSIARQMEANANVGQWLVSLYVPFEQSRSNTPYPEISEPRTQILDASWAMSGGCIVVLLANGMWGVWDIDGSGPNPIGGLLHGTSTTTGSISGAGTTPFALRGSLAKKPSSKSEHLAKESTTRMEPKQLAPMTPNTRRTKQDHLFAQQAHMVMASIGTTHGGISATPNWTNDEKLDDSLLLWYNAEVYPVPSLQAYWQNAANRSSANTSGRAGFAVGGTPYGASIPVLSHFSSGGEAITNVSQIVDPINIIGRPSDHPHREIVVSAEHRVLVVQPQKMDGSGRVEDELTKLFEAPRGSESHPHHLDQDLLARGELDLGGMDRMLNGMSASRGTSGRETFGGPNQRRVGFAAGY